MISAQIALGELCRLVTDGKHGDCQNQPGSGFYFLSAKDVRDGKLNYDGARQITEADFLDTHRRTQLEANDLVISNSGTIGRMALVKNQPETFRTTFQKSVAILKPKHEQVLASWLYYYLHYDLERLIGFAGGTAQKNLLLRDLRAFSIGLQSLPTQRKIAGILSAYDDLIENNTRRIAILEEMAQAIYREWFIHFRFPDHEKVGRIDSPLGKIPEGWNVIPFSHSADFVNGFAFKPEHWGSEGKPIVKIAELKNGITSKTPRNSGDDIPAKYLIRSGDILFSWSADLDAYVWPHEDGLLNQHLFKVLPKSGFDKPFLYFALKNRMQQFRNLSLGTTMGHIKRSALDHVSFVAPPDDIRHRFSDYTVPLIRQQIVLTKKLAILWQTRDLLLPKLISGKLDVEEIGIETGEPLVEAIA